MTEFDKYIRQGEPDQKEKAAAWQVAIGLQDVDGLKPSEYLIQTAQQHIEGEISIDEVVAKKLAAMDLTASIMCMEQKMPMLVFALDEKDSIINAVHGKFVGTKVTV